MAKYSTQRRLKAKTKIQTNVLDALFCADDMDKKKVQVGKYQEKAQPEKGFPLKNRDWEKNRDGNATSEAKRK